MKRALKIASLLLLVLILAGVGGFVLWVRSEIKPVATGKPFYIRFDKAERLQAVLAALEEKKVIRNAVALGYYARWKKEPETIGDGTYEVQPGMGAAAIFKAITHPIVQMVRIPETNLTYRTANLLQKKQVLDGAEYKELVKKPDEFQPLVKFPLPKTSLEGYLYPDTYDLPPLYGAKNTIVKQLEAFGKKVEPLLQKVKNPREVITVASMVELEAGADVDRPMIAGVIRNRLNKGMPLQIDATIIYALGKWRRLTNDDYRNTISDYNTYLHTGLPPGPICSPSVKSVEAALHPTKHNYLYYVAMPNGLHTFAATYEEHLKNVAKSRALRKQAEKAAKKV